MTEIVVKIGTWFLDAYNVVSNITHYFFFHIFHSESMKKASHT